MADLVNASSPSIVVYQLWPFICHMADLVNASSPLIVVYQLWSFPLKVI
jgi:hypothetical protein